MKTKIKFHDPQLTYKLKHNLYNYFRAIGQEYKPEYARKISKNEIVSNLDQNMLERILLNMPRSARFTIEKVGEN